MEVGFPTPVDHVWLMMSSAHARTHTRSTDSECAITPSGNQNITTCAPASLNAAAALAPHNIGIDHKAGKFHSRVQSLPKMIKLMATLR